MTSRSASRPLRWRRPSADSASALAAADLFPLGVEGGENLFVGYSGSETAQPLRSVAPSEFATQRRLGDVRNAHPSSASLSGEVVGKIHVDSGHAHSIHTPNATLCVTPAVVASGLFGQNSWYLHPQTQSHDLF